MSHWRDLISARHDPLLRFNWDIESLYTPAGSIGKEYVEELSLPLPKFDSDSAVFKSRKYYWAKFEDYGVMTIKFYEDQNLTVTKWLRAWQGKIKTPNGNYNAPKDYKGIFTINSVDAVGEVQARFILNGVFPTQVPSLPFGSTGEAVTLDVEFSVDSMEMS